jgi:hypothetical protein
MEWIIIRQLLQHFKSHNINSLPAHSSTLFPRARCCSTLPHNHPEDGGGCTAASGWIFTLIKHEFILTRHLVYGWML